MGLLSSIVQKAKAIVTQPVKAVKGVVKSVLTKPTSLVESYINQYHNQPIVDILVCKLPLPHLLQKAVNTMVPGGEDMTAYHVFQVIETKGQTLHMIRTDKNQTVVMDMLSGTSLHDLLQLCGENKRVVPGVEEKHITFSDYFQNAERIPGPSLWVYDAVSNNCQDFVYRCLEGNDLMTPELRTFIRDAQSTYLKQGLPVKASKAARIITNALAFGEHAARKVGAKLGLGLAPPSKVVSVFDRTKKLVEKMRSKVAKKAPSVISKRHR